MRILVDACIVFGLFFAFAGVVGMLRMPDSFCRMQSSTNVSTFGVLGVIVGGILYAGFSLHNAEMVVKLVVLGLFYLITQPVAGHAIARGAYKHGVRKTDEMACDQYKEDLE